MELLLFALDDAVTTAAARVGMDGVVVDLERRGKQERQAGFDTDVTVHTVEDVARIRELTSLPLIVRVDGPGPGLRSRLADVAAAGADEVLVPMVVDAAQAAECLRVAPSHLPVGILVEQASAVGDAARIGRLPLARVYVGLMDLMVERGGRSPFTPLVDGTVDRVRRCVLTRFGVGGLTSPGHGRPLDAGLLAGELVRLACDFTFLRRSFLQAVAQDGLSATTNAVRALVTEMGARDPEAEATDRRLLEARLARPAPT